MRRISTTILGAAALLLVPATTFAQVTVLLASMALAMAAEPQGSEIQGVDLVGPAPVELGLIESGTGVLPDDLTGPGLDLLGPPPSLIFQDLDSPNWRAPWLWVPRDSWANSVELGVNGASGNANSFSFQAGSRFKRKTEASLFDLRMTHNRTRANGIEKQYNALLYSDFDRTIGHSHWSTFMKNGLEYDRFKAFNLRYNVNVGLAYRFIKSENLNLKGRFGSGISREFDGPDNRWVPEALLGGDYEHQITKRNKWIARADYYPEWGNISNYRIVSDMSWEMLWDLKGNLSFKLSAIDRYDSTPNGRQPNDLTYSLLLLYKF